MILETSVEVQHHDTDKSAAGGTRQGKVKLVIGNVEITRRVGATYHNATGFSYFDDKDAKLPDMYDGLFDSDKHQEKTGQTLEQISAALKDMVGASTDIADRIEKEVEAFGRMQLHQLFGVDPITEVVKIQ